MGRGGSAGGGPGIHPAPRVLNCSGVVALCSTGFQGRLPEISEWFIGIKTVTAQRVIKGLRITCTFINMNNFFNWLHGA